MTSIRSQEGLAPTANHPQNRTVKQYFVFSLVNDSTEMRENFKIRYQVYCLERGFLDPKYYPEGQESDPYDAHALHVLASHRTGHGAGTARLVLHSSLGLPLAHHCQLDPPFRFLTDLSDARTRRYAEISRLAVSREFRRREGDTVYGGLPRQDRAHPNSGDVIAFYSPNDIPEIVSGIYRLLYQESKRRGITHWVVAMERSLNVMLKRMGFVFSPIGPEVDYYGPVRPYMAEIAAIERHTYLKRPQTLRYMLFGLEPHLVPSYARDPSWETMASIA